MGEFTRILEGTSFIPMGRASMSLSDVLKKRNESTSRKVEREKLEEAEKKGGGDSKDTRLALNEAKGGVIKSYASGGYVKAADGIAQRGKTRGRMC